MQEMSDKEVRELIDSARLCHLGLSDEDRAYVLPIFYGYDGDSFYFHSHPGLKDEYMDHTKEACLVITGVFGSDDWNSVQAFGKVEKCSLSDDLKAAESALMDVPLPPEFGFMPSGNPKRSDQHMYFWKLKPARISGRKSARHVKE